MTTSNNHIVFHEIYHVDCNIKIDLQTVFSMLEINHLFNLCWMRCVCSTW